MASELGDTTYIKIFVGGLAWETQSDTLKSYFEQFGEIHEAVVITDRSSRKSKGYGFVTFKDPESAKRACQDPYPVIDGRRANCNLAYLGAQKNHHQHHVTGTSTAHGTSKYLCQPVPVPQYPVSYSASGYPTYSQHVDGMNVYATNWTSRFPAGVYINYYPFYAHNHYQFPYLPFGILSVFPSLRVTARPATAVAKVPGTTASQQNSSS